ncbi:MAG: HAD family hydrolase, partial [Chloroflexota bacterium]
ATLSGLRMKENLLKPQVISLDVEGTLVTHHFTRYIWQSAVPRLYAQQYGLTLEEAEETVLSEYHSIGMGRAEWFDIDYWVRRFRLGEAEPLIEGHRSLIEFYLEVPHVLDALSRRYTLVAASSTPLRFLHYILRDMEQYFTHVFSATTRFGKTKDIEFFEWMCAEMDVAPGSVVHVGDSWEGDYLSASGAGMVSLHLDRSRDDGASLSTLADLLALLA